MALRDLTLRGGRSTSARYDPYGTLRVMSRTARCTLRCIQHVTRYDHDVYGAIRVRITTCTAQNGALQCVSARARARVV